MPLRQTTYGGECPLNSFSINIPAGAGCYDRSPIEACLSCNFSDTSVKKFDLEKICQCPSDMDWNEYDKLRKQYVSSAKKKLTKKSFWKFIKGNYGKVNNDKDLRQRILRYLVEHPCNDIALECHVCKTEAEVEKFHSVLEDMVNNKLIDWHPLDKNTPKDESVPYGELARMYHIARPDFTELINYFKKLAVKIRSKFYH